MSRVCVCVCQKGNMYVCARVCARVAVCVGELAKIGIALCSKHNFPRDMVT